MRRFSSIGICVCAALTLALPAAAAAKPGYKVHPGSFGLTIGLPRHDGASYSISASDHRHVELRVFKDEAFLTYRVEGRASSHGVHANFGPLGRVDLKIDLEGNEPVPFLSLPGCKGKRPAFLLGRFHGSIRYSGEGDVKGLIAHRGAVGIEREFRTVCKTAHHHRHPHRHHPKKKKKKKKNDQLELDLLFAKSRGEGRKVELAVLNLSLPSKPSLSFAFVFAVSSEQRGRVLISRSFLEITEHILALSKRGATPETALVKIPKPFLGSATYSDSQDSAPTWSGDLRLPLPGAGVVPLTGPSFRVKFCRSRSDAELNRCLQGSGSHSQPLALAKLSSLRYLWNSSSSAGSTLYTWSGSGKWRLRTSAP